MGLAVTKPHRRSPWRLMLMLLFAAPSAAKAVPGTIDTVDSQPFTAGSSPMEAVGGAANDALPPLGQGVMAAARLTPYRALHTNLRDALGNELGTAAHPLSVVGSSSTSSATVYPGANTTWFVAWNSPQGVYLTQIASVTVQNWPAGFNVNNFPANQQVTFAGVAQPVYFLSVPQVYTSSGGANASTVGAQVLNWPASQVVSFGGAGQPITASSSTAAFSVYSSSANASMTFYPASGQTYPVSATSLPLPANAAQESGGHLASIDTYAANLVSLLANQTSGAQKTQVTSVASSSGTALVTAYQAAGSTYTVHLDNPASNYALETGGHLATVDTNTGHITDGTAITKVSGGVTVAVSSEPTAGTIGSVAPSSGSLAGFKDGSGNLQAGKVDANGFLQVNFSSASATMSVSGSSTTLKATFYPDQASTGTVNVGQIGGAAPSATNYLPARLTNGASYVDPTQIRSLASGSDSVSIGGTLPNFAAPPTVVASSPAAIGPWAGQFATLASTGTQVNPLLSQWGQALATPYPYQMQISTSITLSNTAEQIFVSSGGVNVKYILQNCIVNNSSTTLSRVDFRGSGNGGNVWFPLEDAAPWPTGFSNQFKVQPTANANITVQASVAVTDIRIQCDYIAVKTQ